MLQPTSTSSSCAQTDEVATSQRPFEGRVWGDGSSEASSDTTEDTELPECKIKRNYNCTKCTFYTQNPRAFLVHSRDVHYERIRIYDCTYCIYASRHQQKLIRHIKMVHNNIENENKQLKTEPDTSQQTSTEMSTNESHSHEVSDMERYEDMLEEVEDVSDVMENEEGSEEPSEHISDNRPVGEDRQKQQYFSCTKCNYVTHIRSRYTKHVKYHSMPMIKCTICDFRTPYKWNLDRHMKNHGGSGNFKCTVCNFTADIKQSLTVHEMNHHHSATTGQSPASRRRNRVGASDSALTVITKEEEGSGDSQSADMGANYADIELVSCHSESNDGSLMDVSKTDDVQSNETHSPPTMYNEEKIQKSSKKVPRPIPQLIPLCAPSNTSKINNTGEPPCKKIKESNNIETENNTSDVTITPLHTNPVIAHNNTTGRKKNESFFDKLKERLLTETSENGTLTCKNCGFESKCLSEHSVHEKNCTVRSNRIQTNTTISSHGSTRCQNCRHRCKSSADLINHLKTCNKNESSEKNDDVEMDRINEPSTSSDEKKDVAPHPMENVVFVWNNLAEDSNKFRTPLDININDDSTLPSGVQIFDPDTVDENDGLILSPTQAIGKKVFKCPQCPFWASTASRFHVHIVGHLNKKPFECSLCKYKSNWRWDITKHIKLKSVRDPDHNNAKVLMTDETGRRNYSKYNRFLAVPVVNEQGENEFIYVDQDAATADTAMDIEESLNDTQNSVDTPLDLQTQSQHINASEKNDQNVKPKKTMWKCKKCNYKDPSKEALLEHVREHSNSTDTHNEDSKSSIKKVEGNKEATDLAYRCGHCSQLSNWKHVIQRHCRLKHDGVIKVMAVERPKNQEPLINEVVGDTCPKCPYKSADNKQMATHLQQHTPSPLSIFKCYFCPFFVRNENELTQHLLLHGINDPEDYISKVMDGKVSLAEPASTAKRHKCTECPYETNSKSQYMYHEQFHRLPADTPYKCPECNYSVSKRHLLHQHLRVHGIFSKKSEADLEAEASTSIAQENEIKTEPNTNFDEVPYVWVSAKNEFHKMYKCRYCSYVNNRKCKIPTHENIHILYLDCGDIRRVLNKPLPRVYKCLECKFTNNSATKLSEHSKIHEEIYGRIHCPVDEEVPDEEQIQKLRQQLDDQKNNIMEGLASKKAHSKENSDTAHDNTEHDKVLHFCQKCPARFFTMSELDIHEKFHDSVYSNKCKNCEFSVPQETQLNAHIIVHTDEYNIKTRMLRVVHEIHSYYKEPKLELSHSPRTSELTWVVSGTNNFDNVETPISIKKHDTKSTPKQYFCKECPAKFFKNSALSYHMGLHGGEGEHKCKKCTYAVKNVGNLAKHEILHETERKDVSADFDSGEDLDYKNIPLSGTDLFQRKTEAQKRVLTDKAKLVKPNDHFPPVLQADPQFGYLMHGNPEFVYPTYMKNGRQKEKRYKCHKCPSAFEKREQYKIHLSLHGSKQRYKCEICDYSVKYYANYVQHMRKHQMNDEALAERKKEGNDPMDSENIVVAHEVNTNNIQLAIKTMPKGLPKSDFQQFSVTDQQTLRLLQRRRSINGQNKDSSPSDNQPTKERKLHQCTLCPYTNQRLDALVNHYGRHNVEEVLNAGCHKCPHCELAVVQSNFMRDHIKTHFNYHKNVTPQCFVANEKVTFSITNIEDNETEERIEIIPDRSNIYKCDEEKLFVQIPTGEIVV